MESRKISFRIPPLLDAAATKAGRKIDSTYLIKLLSEALGVAATARPEGAAGHAKKPKKAAKSQIGR